MGLKKKDNIQDNCLFHHTNRQLKKGNGFCLCNVKGATNLFFVSDKGIKVNSETYKKLLEKEFLPEVDCIMNSNTGIFIQDSAPPHRANIVQDFLKKKLGKSTQNAPIVPRL